MSVHTCVHYSRVRSHLPLSDSGHGSQIPDVDQDETDGFDEGTFAPVLPLTNSANDTLSYLQLFGRLIPSSSSTMRCTRFSSARSRPGATSPLCTTAAQVELLLIFRSSLNTRTSSAPRMDGVLVCISFDLSIDGS
jgi:hypothetical protein